MLHLILLVLFMHHFVAFTLTPVNKSKKSIFQDPLQFTYHHGVGAGHDIH